MLTFKEKLKAGMLGIAATCALSASTVMAEDKVLNIYNWSDYIAEDTIANFEKQTGIKVVYDVFDSNEVLEAKLLSGKTGYDIVVPSASFIARQIKAGVFKPLDKNRLPNWKNLDPELMQLVETYDKSNKHSFPYLWGTTGIGYNPDLVKKYLGEDAPLNSWDLVFNVENISKLKECGVSILDAYDEIIPAALRYQGIDPNSKSKSDYKKAEELLMKIRPYVTYFHSSKYISDLANGDICVAVGWSGDVLQAADRADEAENGVTVEYVIPKEGAGAWFDMLAIPKDASNVDEAYAFLNYLMEPEVMAEIQNYVAYASGNEAAKPLLDKSILDNPGIYPTESAKKNLYTFDVFNQKDDRPRTRIFTKVKSGK